MLPCATSRGPRAAVLSNEHLQSSQDLLVSDRAFLFSPKEYNVVCFCCCDSVMTTVPESGGMGPPLLHQEGFVCNFAPDTERRV